MSTFLWLALLLISGALLFVLPPLLRGRADERGDAPGFRLQVLRDQRRELDRDLESGLLSREQWQAARAALEDRAADELQEPASPDPAESGPAPVPRRTITGISLALALPLLAVTIYLLTGNPGAIPATPSGAAHQDQGPEVESMVQRLQQRLRDQPNDIEGWHMLARSWLVLGRYQEAALAYQHLLGLQPNDPDLLADYADTLASKAGGNLQGEPEQLAARALQQDPRNLKAMSLWGSAAWQRGDFAMAIERWQPVLNIAAPGSELAEATAASIAQAKSRLASAQAETRPDAKADTAGSRQATQQAAAGITGTIDIDARLRAQLRPDDTVFLFARPVQGSRRPVAATRLRVADLPARFELDDSHSMDGNARLSDAGPVIVGARISTSGQVGTPGEGVRVESAPTAPGSSGLQLLLGAQ